jgi:undecaprenyl pyrophosphate phosphatase UppP
MITEPYTVAILKGIVEALTEFLPVSSTGHLMLMNAWMQFTGSAFPNIVDSENNVTGTFMDFFDIFIQVGAILAVCVEFRKTLWQRLWLAFKKDTSPAAPTPEPAAGAPASQQSGDQAEPPVPTPTQARQFWWSLLLGTVPILMVGYGLRNVLHSIEASHTFC